MLARPIGLPVRQAPHTTPPGKGTSERFSSRILGVGHRSEDSQGECQGPGVPNLEELVEVAGLLSHRPDDRSDKAERVTRDSTANVPVGKRAAPGFEAFYRCNSPAW